jgi:hypothetical protein
MLCVARSTGRLIVSDSGDIVAAGRGSLYRTQRRRIGLQSIYWFTPLSPKIPLSCSVEETGTLHVYDYGRSSKLIKRIPFLNSHITVISN